MIHYLSSAARQKNPPSYGELMSAIGEFGGYLSAVFPSQINIDITEFCNLACVHCPYVSTTKPKGKERKNLAPELHAKLVKEIKEDGMGHCRFVRYTGEGEPLLHPNIMQFLKDMHGAGVTTALTTNGLLLTEERCLAILNAEVSVVDVSLDAFKPETYAKIRVGGKLQDAQEGILRLFNMARNKRSKLKLMVSFIRQNLNEGEADDFLSYWKGQGLDNVFVRNLHSCAGQMTDVAEILWQAAPKVRKPCLYPWERLALKADGAISFCPTDWQRGTVIGDLAKDTLKSLWQGKFMESVRRAHVDNNFSKHAFCGQCPDWSVIKWPNEGRSYATAVHEMKTTENTEVRISGE